MNANNCITGRYGFRLSLVIMFILSLFLKACYKNPSEFTLGEEFIESQTSLCVIDTFSVDLSTVILDTVSTSNTGTMLIGHYQDDLFGSITSHSFFQVGLAESLNVENEDRYDSLNLVITYNGYFFGDTTKSQKISVHQLMEKIEPGSEETLSGRSSFEYYPDPAGTVVYSPTPTTAADTLAIRISDEIGLDMFSRMMDDSDVMSTDETFINYFHGLALIADAAYDGAVIGFIAAASDAQLILYTSRGTSSVERIKYRFKLNTVAKQFNNINHDFSSTPLNPLVDQRNELSSKKTGGAAYLQGGTGLTIRVDFPSLDEILLREQGVVVKAQLSIAAFKNSYDVDDLPEELYIYESDKLNRPISGVAASSLTVDEFFHEETMYTFDITDYLKSELEDSYVDTEKGMLITLSPDEHKSSFERLITDARDKNTKLKIYYLSY